MLLWGRSSQSAKFSQPLAGIPGSRYRCLYLRFHLESLNTLKYTVIIAHVTQSPRREEKTICGAGDSGSNSSV